MYLSVKKAFALVVAFIVSCTFYSANAQDKETIYISVEKAAQFPDGMAAMFKYINENIQYPEDALVERDKGSVMVKFVVEKDGSLSNITIARGLNEALNKEAIRVISSMPKWSPAEISGTPVRSYVTTKVNFKLPE